VRAEQNTGEYLGRFQVIFRSGRTFHVAGHVLWRPTNRRRRVALDDEENVLLARIGLLVDTANQLGRDPLCAVGHDEPVRVADGEPAGMIEVQMCRQHEIDVRRCHASFGQRMIEMPLAVDAVDVVKPRTFLVAETGIDQ